MRADNDLPFQRIASLEDEITSLKTIIMELKDKDHEQDLTIQKLKTSRKVFEGILLCTALLAIAKAFFF